ncbi:uncharacterized protein LDX57_000182 [Aspergillus melleus]|uniref:uncharacterized protein n=1 Tax=Aspergillus melleus TaxID=138277 RepID=UPI001E8CC1A5|nr:uncharacterized protein LDX57_000182 [Aspergillus melleus]KAH8422428.1 hypothetical protein LDX57_000182 [Aspergillus melleus]
MLSDDGFSRAPSSFYLSAFRAELERIRAEIPTELQNNKPIFFHLYHTEVSIYEPALLKATTGEDDLKRLDYLYACLRAVKCFFDLVLSIPSAHFASFPLTHIIQIAHCFVTLFRLSTLDLPGWDRAIVRRTADILDLAHQVAEKWHEVAEIVGNKNKSLHRHAYSGLGAMMYKLKDGWAAKLDPSQSSAPNQNNMNAGEGQLDMDALFGSPESAWLLDAFFSGGIF